MGKLKKEKHNHKLTDFLKVGIFSLVMLAPFISIGSKMAYVTLNKNAYQSYYGETINETQYLDIDNINDINNKKLRFLSNATYNAENLSNNINFTYTNIHNIVATSSTYITALENGDNGFIYYWNNQTRSFAIRSGTGEYTYIPLNSITSFEVDSFVMTDLSLYQEYFTIIQYLNVSYLDNVFEYAVSQLGTTPIFSWTKNTAIYTPIETMTNGLGFDPDNNTLAILLTYWSLVTAVYVIMDVVLFAFTKITHFTQD